MTTPAEPRINHDFLATPTNAVTAILPDARLDECSLRLARAGVDLARVDVLRGEEGSRILDIKGVEHGVWGHLVRNLQKLGTVENERVNYAEALHDGQVVVIVPSRGDDDANTVGEILYACGGRRILHFGRGSEERLSY